MIFLLIGDIYGQSGREFFLDNIHKIVVNNKIDFIIVNGENTTHGKGIIEKHFYEYKQAGVDVVTSGNHIFKHKETLEFINNTPTLLRPMNMSCSLPGKGYVIVEKNNKKICVANLMGRTYMDPCDNPYDAMDNFLALNLDYDYLFVDFHAEATAEKIAFALNYDGIITGFFGTHTHVPTADERILPNGTAFITDLGMTGVFNSVIGVNPDEVIHLEKTGLQAKFVPAIGDVRLNGAIITTDEQKAIKIQRFIW